MTKKQRHLIIGGSGQDGALLADYLVKKGFDVHTTCRNKTSFSLERLIYLQILEEITVHKCDIRNLSKLKDVLESVLPNYVYFLAGYTKTADSFSEILEIADSNLKPVCFMLDFLRKYMPDTKCLFAGSSEIFDAENIQNKVDLKSRFAPKNPYGASKLFLFNVVKQYREYYNLPVMTALLFNHESELRSHYFVTKKITKNLVTFSKNNEYSFQLGNIDAKRDWSAAKDFVRCFYEALSSENKVDDILLASGKLMSVREFIKLSARILNLELVFDGEGLNEKIFCKKTGKLIISISPRYYRELETNGLAGDPTETIQKTGWSPNYTFEMLLEEMIKYEIEKN